MSHPMSHMRLPSAPSSLIHTRAVPHTYSTRFPPRLLLSRLQQWRAQASFSPEPARRNRSSRRRVISTRLPQSFQASAGSSWLVPSHSRSKMPPPTPSPEARRQILLPLRV